MVSVIVCTYNRAAALDGVLRDLTGVEPPPGGWEVVVVDNNSTDATPEVVRRWTATASVPVVGVVERRQGQAYARNRGIAAARGDVLVFTDDDVEFDRAWLRSLVAPFASADVAGAAGRIVPVWPGPVPRWWADSGPYRLYAAVVYFNPGPEPMDLRGTTPVGANLAFRRDVFARHGLFREDLGRVEQGLMSADDSEFGHRVMAAGERIVYVPSAVVRHPVEPVRTRKGYFRRWYFGFGRTSIRWHGRPAGCAEWAGVPRFLVRELLEAAGRAAAAGPTRRGFYHQLKAIERAGMIYECWKEARVERRGAA